MVFYFNFQNFMAQVLFCMGDIYYLPIMKDQIKTQITNAKFQQDILLIADQLQTNSQNDPASFEQTEMTKKIRVSGLQKKSNPRLFIL